MPFTAKCSMTWFAAFVCALVCVYHYHIYYTRAVVEIELQVEQPGILKIYRADDD